MFYKCGTYLLIEAHFNSLFLVFTKRIFTENVVFYRNVYSRIEMLFNTSPVCIHFLTRNCTTPVKTHPKAIDATLYSIEKGLTRDHHRNDCTMLRLPAGGGDK